MRRAKFPILRWQSLWTEPKQLWVKKSCKIILSRLFDRNSHLILVLCIFVQKMKIMFLFFFSCRHRPHRLILSSCGWKSCVSWSKRPISTLHYLPSTAQSQSHALAGKYQWLKPCTIGWNYFSMQFHNGSQLHTVSFDWFLSGLEWILNLEFS